MAKSFQVTGSAVITKIKISANARKQLQGLVVNIDTSQITKQLKKVRKAINSAFRPLKNITKQSGGVKRLANNMNALGNAATRTNRQLKRQESLLVQVVKKASAFRVSTIAINSVFNALSDAVRFTIEFDDAMRNVNKILRLNDKDLNALGDSIIDVAKSWNLTAEEVATAARTAAQAGLGDQADVLEFISEAAKTAAASTLDFAGAQEALLAIARQTNSTIVESSTIIAKFASIEDKAAVEAKQLAGIFNKAGTSIALAFGDNINKAIGAFAALLERTRQTDKVIGTFGKTALARLSGANESAIKAIKDLGVAVEDEITGKLRDPIELLKDFQKALDGLSGTQAGAAVGKVFGIRQAELGKALLEVIKDGGRADQLAQAAGAGFADQFIKINQETDKFAAKINSLQQEWNKLVNSLKESVALPLIEQLEKVEVVLRAITGGAGGLQDVASGLAITGAGFGAGFLGRQLLTTPEGRERAGERQKARGAEYARRAQAQATQPAGPLYYGDNKFKKAANVATRNMSRFNKVLKIGRYRVAQATNAFGPLSVQSAAAAAGLTIFGQMLQNQESHWQNTLGGILTTFGQATLILGAKFGLIATGGVELGKVLSGTSDVTKAFSLAMQNGLGILKDSKSGTLARAFTDAQAFIDNEEGRKALQADELFEQIAAGTASQETMEQLGKVITDVFTEARNTNRELADRVRVGLERVAQGPEGEGEEAAAAFAKLEATVEKDREKLNKGIREAIIEGFNQLAKDSPGAFEALANVDTLRKIVPYADADVAKEFQAALKGLEARGGTFGRRNIRYDKLVEGFEEGALRDALLKATERFSGTSDEAVEALRKVTEQETKLITASKQLAATQAQLLGVRTAADVTTAIKAQRDAQLDLQRIALKNLEERRQALIDQRRTQLEAVTKEKGGQRDRFLQARFEDQAKIEELRREIIELGEAGVFTSTRLTEARNEIKQLEKNVDEFGNKAREAQAEVSKAQSALTDLFSYNPERGFADPTAFLATEGQLTEARLKLAQQGVAVQVAAIDALAEVENERRDRALDLLSATNQLKDAEAGLADIRAGAGADPTAAARRRLDSVREQNRLEQLAYNDRIKIAKNVLNELVKVEIEGAKRRVATLKEELQTRGGANEEGNAKLAEELGQAESDLAKLQSRAIAGNQEIAQLQADAATSAIEGRKQEIQAIGQVIASQRRLKEERLDAVEGLMTVAKNLKKAITDVVKAQAGISNAIRGRLDAAANQVKSRRSELEQAYAQLASARASLADALQGGTDAFAEYNKGIRLATVEADKLLGKFFGFRDEASALADAFEASITAAQQAGASERQLADLRAEAAEEQLRIYQELLDRTRSQAEQWFTSDAEGRREYVEGLANIQRVVEQFQGNIDNFRNMSPDQLNTFGSQLISLPQEVRQGMLAALDQLPDGVGIAGLSADEIREILLGGAYGENEELGIESLSETMLTVAELMQQAAEAQTGQLSEAQKQTVELQAQVAAARDGVGIAKAMLDQAHADAVSIQRGIADVKATINTQLSTYRNEFITASNRIEASNKTDAQKIELQQKEAVKYLNNINTVLGGAAGMIGGLQPGQRVTNERTRPSLGDPTSRDVLTTIGNNINAASERLSNTADGLTKLGRDWLTGLGDNAKKTEQLAGELLKLAEREYLTKTEALINIDNQQKITVAGATEIANQILSVIEERGWITDDQMDVVRDALRLAINRQVEAGIAPASDRLQLQSD